MLDDVPLQGEDADGQTPRVARSWFGAS
jgi:hypothetical protein